MKKMVGDILITDEILKNGIRVYYKAERTFAENEDGNPISFICQVIPKPPILNELQDQYERLQKISDKNIIKYYEFKETDHNYYIFMEKMNQDVFEAIIEKEFISEDQAKHFLREILNALKGLHQNDITFVDLNPKSIFKKNDELKIGQINIYLDQISQLSTDEEFQKFGLVKEIIPPEILQGKILGSIESDLFAVSCIYFRMLYKRYPFIGETKQELLKNMEKSQIDFTNQTKEISQQSIDFLKQTLKFEPDNRLKWTQVYCHPLLQSLNIPNQHMAQSLLLSISMSKMMFRQDLINKDFDIQKNQKFYEQKIEGKSQIRIKNNQNNNEQSTFFMNICPEQDKEEIKQIQQQVCVLENFFSEQRTKLIQEQIDFYLQQRNIYSSLCQSLTYVRLFDSEFKSQLLEYLILKIIYLLASSLMNQLNEFDKLLGKWNIEQNLKDQFKNLKFKIDKENNIIQQQFDKFHNMQTEKVKVAKQKGKQIDEKITQILNKEQQFSVYESFFNEMKKFIEQSVTFQLWKKNQEALIHQINLQLILSFSLLISYFLKWEPKQILEKSQVEYQDYLIKQNDLEILKQEQENKLSKITEVFSQFKDNQKKQ